jgi:hypothetical protein
MQKQILKKAKHELQMAWRHAMEDAGFYKAVEYYGWSAWRTSDRGPSRFQSPDTVGDYREMMIYTDYDPNTRNAKLLFGLEYDEKVDKFYIAYVYKPKPSGNYPPSPEDEEKIFMSYLDFDYFKWRLTKDTNVIYKMVFPNWEGDFTANKHHICLDFCGYVSKMVGAWMRERNMTDDF